MTRQTYMFRRSSAGGIGPDGQVFASITLPAIPGVVPTSDRYETQPTMPAIKTKRLPVALRGAAEASHIRRLAEIHQAARSSGYSELEF